ncbi:hypothetical protein I308_106391 [Cryptococcus tetragattii IND107]|uniref:Uncharacterized protein n=1 Tax=Cryptococcus tetragattii IND107 TaxID=1296105 RepID=A0ABR3BIT0_9TREE
MNDIPVSGHLRSPLIICYFSEEVQLLVTFSIFSLIDDILTCLQASCPAFGVHLCLVANIHQITLPMR